MLKWRRRLEIKIEILGICYIQFLFGRKLNFTFLNYVVFLYSTGACGVWQTLLLVGDPRLKHQLHEIIIVQLMLTQFKLLVSYLATEKRIKTQMLNFRDYSVK